MKPTPQLSVIYGYFTRKLSRDEAAEILRVTREESRGVRFRQSHGVYRLGGLLLYTMLADS